MPIRVTIQWTSRAKELLANLPVKVKNGLARKIGDLRNADPRRAGKPLVGPFQGCRRITHGRYRAIFSVEERKLASGEALLHITVTVIAVGMRKEHDKKDVYRVAQKLIELGLLPAHEDPDDEG